MSEIWCPLQKTVVEFYGAGEPIEDMREYSQVSPCRGCAKHLELDAKYLSILVSDMNVVDCQKTSE